MHCDSGLVIFCSGKYLRRFSRNGGIFFDELGHHAAHGFNAQRQGRDIQQQHVFNFTAQYASLDRRACGHRFIGIDIFARLFAEEFLDLILHLGHTGLTADQYHVINLRRLQTGILERDSARGNGTLDQLFHQ